MADIVPFKGTLYNQEKVKDISKVLAPPYDVISPEEQEKLYNADTHNIIRILLGKESSEDNKKENKYIRAAKSLKEWQKEGVLEKDKEDSIYIYEQEFTLEGKTKKRLGFMALLKLEEFDTDSSTVYPHEYTLPEPKKDRTSLLSTIGANLGPIFALFADEDKSLGAILARETKSRPLIEAMDFHGIKNRLWRVTDKGVISKIVDLIKKEKLFIADGHHRYEVGLAFSKTKKDPKYGYILSYFTDLYADGIEVLPVHRLIGGVKGEMLSGLKKDLQKHFTCKDISSKEDVPGFLSGATAKEKRFVVYAGGSYTGLSLEDNDALDVLVLHEKIVEPLKKKLEKSQDSISIDFTKDLSYAVSEVDNEKFSLSVMLNPIKVTQIRDTAFSGKRMPQKSTYFYPKVITGLVINVF